MKRFLAGLIAGVVIAAAPIAYAELTPIKLVVNGAEVTLPDAQPTVIDGRVMVPLLPFSQVAGFDVVWDEANRAVNVTTRTVATAPASAPTASAEPVAPLTITEDGVTYYETDHLRTLLETLYPGARVGIGVDGMVINGKGYRMATRTVNRKLYIDVTPLLEARVLTQADLDRHYGR